MKELFSFTGRARRRDYWISQLLYSIFAFMYFYGNNEYNDGMMYIGILGMIVGFVPVIGIQVRRFHDINRSGLLVLLNLVPYIGTFINTIWMGFMGPVDSKERTNQFGANPRLD